MGMAATELGELVFDTERTARTYANLQGVHRVAVVVGWDERQTVPVKGVAHQPTGEDRERCASAYPTHGQAEQRVRKPHPEHSSGSRRDGYGTPTSGPALPACAKPPGPDRLQPARRADQPSSTRGRREKVTYAQPSRGVREVSAQSSGSISGNRVSTSGAWSTSVMSRSVVYGQNSR